MTTATDNPLERARILLVEDNPASARVAALVLRAARAEVSHAASATEATRMVLGGLRPALVLLDLELPDLSGLDFVKVLRSIHDTRDTPIVACTASDIVDDEAAVIDAGCDGMIRKPIDVETFASTLAAYLAPGWTRRSRHATSKALPALRDHQQSILDALPKAVALTRPSDLTFVYANRKLEAILGYGPGELIGMSLARVTPGGEAGAAQVRDRIRAELDRRGEAIVDGPRLRADGTTTWIRGTLTRFDAPELGELWLLAGDDIGRELDADQDLKRALARSESRFASVWRAGILGIAIDDTAGTVVDANDRFLAMIGRTREELLHGHIRRDAYLAPERAVVTGERGVEPATPREQEYLRPDGSRIPVLVDRARLDAEHEVGYAIDLTEKRRGEIALRESHRRFDALWRSGLIGVVIARLDGQLLEANDSYLSIIGHDRADLEAGRINYMDFIPPDQLEVTMRAGQQVVATGVTEPWETVIVHKSGHRVPVLCGVVVLDAETSVAIVSDLTARKRAEDQLRQTEDQLRQAQKMEAVGRLAGGIAHDFNNLLSVIVSYGDLLLSELRSSDPMAADLKEILTAAMRATELTRQLLVFSRQQLVEAVVLDASVVLRGMDRMLERLIGEDIALAVSAADSEARIQLAPSYLEQIIVNLAVNARDAMVDGGQLTIETSAVELDESFQQAHGTGQPGRYVMLAVTDTGTGMDRETQRRIFEPFFTTKPVGKGTGLGLSTVFGIVQQAGGFIRVDSVPGKGTRFELYFPRVDAEAVQPRPAAPARSLRGTETVLVVEDEQQVRKVACGILRRNGYVVLDAGSPGEALLVCERHPERIHLLVTDVIMPHMNGPELASRLLALRPDLRVLCMSGYTDDAVARHRVVEQGMAFLQKPFTPELLARRVREVLDEPERP